MKKKEEIATVIEAFKKASVDLIDVVDELNKDEKDFKMASQLSHTTDALESEIYDPYKRFDYNKDKALQRLEGYVANRKEG